MSKESRKASKDEKDSDLDDNEKNQNEYEDHLSAASSSVGSLTSLNSVEMDVVNESFDFVNEGLETDADSVLCVEEIPENARLESSLDEIECFAKTVLYEFPSDCHEENKDHQVIPLKGIPLAQNTKIPSMKILDSPDNNSRIKNENQAQVELWKLPQDKENEEISVEKYSRGLKDYIKNPNNKEFKANIIHDQKVSVSEEVPHTAEAIKNPGTPIYKYINLCPKSSNETFLFDDNVQNKTFLDHSSDEFADIEDNVKNSSSNSNEETHNGNSGEASSSQVGTDKEQSNEYFHKCEPITLPIVTNEYISESSSCEEIGKIENPTLSGFSETKKANVIDVSQKVPRKPHFTFPNVTDHFEIHSETKTLEAERMKKIIQTMPVIPETSEPDENNKTRKDYQASTSKTNPLKMKTKVSTKKNRCGVCNVRLNLCAIRCRCGNYYCAKHRYDREHNCTFDYRKMGKEEIRKNNPKVEGEKVRKL